MAAASSNQDLGMDPEKAQQSDTSSAKAEASGAYVQPVDKATERAVLRKLDYRIVPMVMWVYLMNMMDRG
jgi:hypothetical protein